jgi:AcrR family transcriptional regulator
MTPISDCQVRDPRIRRTRKLLQGALGSLMQSKSFDEISVQDIAEVATVNRATFYDHYTDKYALLEAMIAGGFHELLHARQVHYDGGCPSAVGAIIRATCDFFTEMHGGGACARQTACEPLKDAAITAASRGCVGGGQCGHLWWGEAVVLHGRPAVRRGICSPVAGADFAYATGRVSSCGCNPSGPIVTSPREIGRRKRRGPALPGFM